MQYCNAVLAFLAYEGGSIQFFRVNTKFAHKLRRHKQTFGKIATPVVLRLKFIMIRVAMTSELS